ncbi:MAG: hypothetical protein QGF03_07095, partial [SAR324 cluster bacterium]|nr:hypothetical protein [SAR324 cluster bacterium]
ISLDLTSKSDQIGIWNNTGSFDIKRFYVPFGRSFTAYAKQAAQAPGSKYEGLTEAVLEFRGVLVGEQPLDFGFGAFVNEEGLLPHLGGFLCSAHVGLVAGCGLAGMARFYSLIP